MGEHKYQVVIAGPGSVGKSAITLQFISQQFIRDYDPTIEECYKKHIFVDNEVAYLDILDTAGQEEYSSLRSHHFQNGDGFLLVYACDNRKSFEEIGEFRDEIIRAKDDDDVPIVLLANKCDLPKGDQQNVINIEESFAQCVREIRKRRAVDPSGPTAGQTGKKKKGCLMM
ncbi:ras gtpase-related [Anaeramoeba ignava]|uniref:Ras gtpase-related n=1 Tax=Anaeramoeba ignava TaxID=1746090 RepID=A0A9Q0RB91_ANAIG|nr:ras gtpase-related [Anaeramoeba ignava]